MSLAATLASIADLADQKVKQQQYQALLQQILASGNVQDCQELVTHVVDDVPLVVGRALLTQLADSLVQLPLDSQITIATFTLNKAQPRLVSFEEQLAGIRERLAELHEQQEDWSKAAHVLAGMDLETGSRQLEPEYKLEKNVKIAMLFLEDDDAVNAELYIKKASALVALSKNPTLEMQYKTCSARILDAKRKFTEAAVRYYELSQLITRHMGDSVAPDELDMALSAAVTCVILAPPSPQRSRVLAQLYKDERCTRLRLYPFLEKVYLERILATAEVAAFAQTLKEHQLAKLADGSTVLERAVMEHNLAAAAKLYINIYREQLGSLLGVAPEKAEAVAATMISEGRLQGRIDQVSGLLTFESAEGGRALQSWDHQILELCGRLNNVIEVVSAKGLVVNLD